MHTHLFQYLPRYEARVNPAHAHQVVVSALLDATPLVHDGDVVRIHDRRQPANKYGVGGKKGGDRGEQKQLRVNHY